MAEGTDRTWTMRDVHRILGVHKHQIIYLIEEGVVKPLLDAKGRGKVRRFSARNVFEFCLALEMLNSDFPADYASQLITLLGKFEKQMRKRSATFELPASLASAKAPNLRAVFSDGHCLTLVIASGSSLKKATTTLNLRERSSTDEDVLIFANHVIQQVDKRFGQPEGSLFVRTEISLNRIAQHVTQALDIEK